MTNKINLISAAMNNETANPNKYTVKAKEIDSFIFSPSLD